MKKIIMLFLTAALLLSGFIGQAMAQFNDGDLIRVVYSSDGAMENATDLGSIKNITSPVTSNVPVSTISFSLASLGAGATPANSYVSYYSYNTGSGANALGYVWTSGNSGGQTAKFGDVNSIATGYNLTTGLYFPLANSPSQATVLMSDPNSYWSQMDTTGGTVGGMAGFLPNGDGEARLAALSTTGYVDQTLYYYVPVSRATVAQESGLAVATIRTYANGTTQLLVPGGSTTTFTITATSGANGSVTPTGTTTVNFGGSQTYTITPATGYSVSGVLVDGTSVGAVTTYTFSNVTANHTISATFTAGPTTFTITATAGANGSVTAPGTTTVNSGASQTYTITPATGYSVSSVLVDGASVGAVTTYTFTNVTANHTISATFAPSATSGTGIMTVGSAAGASYSTIQAALTAAVNGDTIEVQALTYPENDTCNYNLSVALSGGFDSAFSTNSSNYSVISGKLTISNGTVTVQNIKIQ